MKKLKTLTAIVACLAGLTLSAPAKANVDTNLPEYKPLTNLVGQGFDYVADNEGNLYSCIFLHYDRNDDSGWGAGGFKGVDLIEYRRMTLNEEGYWVWEKHPYVVVVDDDFDGYADREFIDNGEVKDG